MNLRIKIETVPQGKQRYDTLGDWFYEPDGTLHVRVTELRDWRMEFAIAIHELVESALCIVANVSQQQVDDFDFGSDAEEPGDDPAAPYHRQHKLALEFEYNLLALLGVTREEYDTKCRRRDSTSSASKEMEPGSQSGS